ncbi:uncharacterized protein tasor2 isoform X3 [Micropterus dolomieu]|uniref:uncharacterized protein tasor2 isoform X3 n=1 Tax=Micropterus dolomieu TaxID=147949 RepID=UPI001E8E8E36|nr:uncharacterized protein tasor2 isoform X3 [Micropterus dolomieu]
MDAFTSIGVLVPVSSTSDVFQSNILAPLKSAYLYEESKQSFRYKSAVLIKNPALEEKYNAFRAKRRQVGYSEEDLDESYGFLLFDDVNKANAIGETGVLTGNSTCTTLGDPSNGVYISMYSDCLDLNRWYHGKSGYIAIIRLTKGRVKQVSENYTQNFTAPTEGFDCHVSEQWPSVSAKTSSFLAFERTQYYMYELLEDGSNQTTQSPSAACPFAIVSFSYTDTKSTLIASQEKSEEKKLVCHYFPWNGQLQIGTNFYDVGLRSTAGALIPAELPPVVNVDRAISMFDLRQLLPRAVFETCFSGEVFLDGLYYSLFELVSSKAEESSSLFLLLWEIKEKDVALTIPLKDSGFLILLHSSHFLTYDDTGSSAAEVLQGMFVFPSSRVMLRDTKFGQRKSAMSSEILRVLPVLSYAEGEVEKTPIDPSEELCEVLAQHMQSYAALINPGLALSPSREVSIFPDQYDVPDAHKHLYSSPEWTNRAWQSFTSYLSKPVSFQLPMSKASEILKAGQEERIEDLDDDVYICLSSPEEALANSVSMGSEDQWTGQKSPINETVDSGVTSAEAQVDLTVVSQNVVPEVLQAGDTTNGLTLLIKPDDMVAKDLLTPSTSDDLPAELIVSITSAEQTVTESLSVDNTDSAVKHNDFQLSGFSTAKLQTAGVNSPNGETVKTKKLLDCSEITSPTKAKRRKRRRGHFKGRKKVSKACVETHSLQTVEIAVEEDNLKSQEEDQAKESSDHPLLINQNIDWRKVQRRKLSSNNKKVRSAVAEDKKSDPGQESLESTVFMELEACPLRRKTERWDLKPVTSECGRILVPFGSADIADQIKSLKDKIQYTKDEQCPENMLVDAPVNAHDTVRMEQDSSTASETAVDETEATTSKDEGNHLQNVGFNDINLEQSTLRQSDNGNGSLILNPERREHSSKKDSTDTPPFSEAVKEKHADTLSPEKGRTKGEFLLNKLKSVLLRGKRKTGHLVLEETTADTTQDSGPCPKMSRVDSDTGVLKTNDSIPSVPNTNLGVKEEARMSVDPLFAYALGLTPKETPEKIKKTEGQDTQQRKDVSETQEQTIPDKQPEVIQRPLSIFPRRGRIKTLKKHQGISAEHVKKKWWLHFQTPASFASEKLKNKECTRDNSVRNPVKEKMNSACSSTDALNLLADLALGASNDQVPPQPDPALERKPETSLKKCDLTKDVTSAEQESVLHALLKQPAARPIQSLDSPSPSHLVGGSELVDLVSKEHAYSLPPSSFLLLGLSGTPLQISPLSGSTRLLHHHQTMYGDGIKTLQPSVGQEDRSEHHMIPEYLSKRMVRRRKFRHSRTFDIKNGSVQVTKQWKENYDFNLDSKFTSDSKDRAIIRALHGPWDYSIQDTSEEVQLIVHMWIGLFYSRSTERFFQIDSNSINSCTEESAFLEMSSGIVFKDNSCSPFLSVRDSSDPSISNALDLSKKVKSGLDEECVILDLSQRDSNAKIVTSEPQVDRKQTSVVGELKEAGEPLNTFKSSMGLPEASKSQCYKKIVPSTEIINEVNGVRRIYENNATCTPSQKAGHMEHTVPSLKCDKTFIPVQEEMESESIQPKKHETASGIGHVLHECNNEKKFMKDGIENSEATEMSLGQNHGRGSSKSMTDEEVDSNKEAGDVIHTGEHDEVESKDGENWEVNEKPCQDEKIINNGDDSTNEEPGVVCNGNLLENEKRLSREEPKAVSPGKAENINEDVDCCTAHEGKVIEGYHYGKEDGLWKRRLKDSCVSAMEGESNLGQPLPLMCDGPDSVKMDCITECNHQGPLEEQTLQADNEEDACNDDHLERPCANGSALTDEHALSEKAHHAQAEMEPIYDEHAVEENSGNYICLAHKPHYQKAASPISDEGTSLSSAAGSIPQTNDSVETGSQNKVMGNLILSSDDLEDQDTKSIEGEQKVGNTTQKDLFNHQSHSPQCEVINRCEAEVALTQKTDLKSNKTNEVLEKIHSGVVIPFIGIDASGEDTVYPHDPHSQGKVEEVVQGQKEILFISETVLPTEVHSTSQMYSKKAELSAGKISLSKKLETHQPKVLGSESDDRCPTPTMDENPFVYLTCSGPTGSSTSAFSGTDTCKNMTEKCVSRSSTPIMDEMMMPLERKLPKPHRSLHPDLELRTLRVLQCIDKFLSKSNHTDKSSQIETADLKRSLDQTPNTSIKHIPTCLAPSHTPADFKDKKINNTKPAAVSPSTSQELHTESSGHFPSSPFSKLEQVLGVRLQLKKTDLSLHQRYIGRTDVLQEESSVGHRSSTSTECLQAVKTNIDQDEHKTTSQTNLSNEPNSYSQRPVMAVKPSKSEEIQADCISKDRENENSVMSCVFKIKQRKTPVVSYTTPASILLEKKTHGNSDSESLMGNSEGLKDKHKARELSSKSSWLSNVSDGKSNSDKAKLVLLDPLYQHEGGDINKFNKIPANKSAKTSSNFVNGNQGFLANSLVERVGQTTKESIEMDQEDFLGPSTSVASHKNDSIINDSLFLGPQSSLSCTVYNASWMRSYSLIEQLSQRCLQDDLTLASMEQECLIFSEQMKQLLKRSKMGPIRPLNAHDKFNLPCSSPVTVHFSSLEEQEDLVDHLDVPSLVGQKIKVDMSDRKYPTDTTEEEKALHPQNLSQGTGNPMEHAGVSDVTAECARQYEAMMKDVCAVKKVPPRPKHLRMDRGYSKNEPSTSNHFDFCDQMKREMDESFRSNLNSVVKKSCKTKYRFYILVTSDDAFFEETKAQLEAEGHTAVQPSEFFLGEDSSSSLLIILRNEDIAEHICEVPHLLNLKKSPGVQFAGIDETDDVVNLTHQELFTRGGFIMIDRAALESLSLCNMKKLSEILQELSRTGKWKWMLHYRDSRRLKENARLSAEAKEKKHFLNWCQEAGIVEVLPYHECDLTSRDQPDYLTCLVHLQVQNISARYPVFITDTTADSTFGKNGILTMTANSFLTCSPSKTFTV